MANNVLKLSRRTKKGRTAAEAAAVKRDAAIHDERHLRSRIMSLTQVVHALLLDREDPEAPIVYKREDMVLLNPDDVSIIITEHARPNAQGIRDADVTIRLLTPKA